MLTRAVMGEVVCMDKEKPIDGSIEPNTTEGSGMNDDEEHTSLSVTVLFEVFNVLLQDGADPVEAFEAAVWDIFTDDVGFYLDRREDPEYARKTMDNTEIRYRCTGYDCSAKFSDAEAASMHEEDNPNHWITDNE